MSRPEPNNMADKAISQGPDIVAESPSWVTTVVEAKGAVSKVSANNTKLTSTVDGTQLRQPGRGWLQPNAAERHLDEMKAATNPDVVDAARRMEGLLRGGDYEGIVVAAAPSARIGKVDDMLEEFRGDPRMVTKVYAVDVTIP